MKKKIYAIIITVVMLANLVCPAMAQTITANSFTGTINLDSSVASKVDLSDIDIKVYSLTVAYTDPTSGQNDYYDNYVFTVNPAKGGVFTFSKPSAEFKIEIDLSTLPSGIGVDKFECTYENGQINDTFTLYSVHNAEMVMENAYSTPTVICYAQNGNRIFADYDIRLSAESAAVSRSASIDILKTQSATFSGAVSSGNSFSFSKTFDLSEMSSLDKVNFYANTKMITEEEKIERYCDLVETMDFEHNTCINSILSEISQYATENIVSENLSAKVARSTTWPSLVGYTVISSNSYFRIHSSSSTLNTLMTTTQSYLLQCRNLLSRMGFEGYISYPFTYDDDKMNVIFIDQPGKNGVSGGTFWEIGTGRSCIAIYFDYSKLSEMTFSDFKETIAHEYFHTVANAYTPNLNNAEYNWFAEASATWFSIYVGNAKGFSNHLVSYFGAQYNLSPINSASTNHYAKALFVLTIDIAYGGYSSVRQIYDYLSTQNYSNFSFANLRTAIDNGLQDNNISGSFNDIFKTFSIYNTNPNYYYSSRIPDDCIGLWNHDMYSYSTSRRFVCGYYGTAYVKISPTYSNTIYSVIGTINFESALTPLYFPVAKVIENDEGEYSHSYVPVDVTTYHINESSLGSSSVAILYYVIINMSGGNVILVNYSLTPQ